MAPATSNKVKHIQLRVF